MKMHHSTPVDWVGKEFVGFVINATFSNENARQISTWLDGLRTVAPIGVYFMQPKGLHITVLDWVAPLLDYGGADKRAMFDELRPSYEPALRRITDGMAQIDVHFTELRVTPSTIILVGQDNGQFQHVRDQFIGSVTLPDGAKQPPDIIHSSLARFVSPEIDLAPVETYVTEHPLELTQRISEVRLTELRREPMQDFTVLDTFKLTAKQ
jgi:hypothetical protein